MRESYIEKKSCDWAEGRGWLQRKLRWGGRNGAPDRLFVKGGVHIYIEFKTPDGALEPIQQKEINRLRDAGCTVYVCDSIEDAQQILLRHEP